MPSLLLALLVAVDVIHAMQVTRETVNQAATIDAAGTLSPERDQHAQAAKPKEHKPDKEHKPKKALGEPTPVSSVAVPSLPGMMPVPYQVAMPNPLMAMPNPLMAPSQINPMSVGMPNPLVAMPNPLMPMPLDYINPSKNPAMNPLYGAEKAAEMTGLVMSQASNAASAMTDKTIDAATKTYHQSLRAAEGMVDLITAGIDGLAVWTEKEVDKKLVPKEALEKQEAEAPDVELPKEVAPEAAKEEEGAWHLWDAFAEKSAQALTGTRKHEETKPAVTEAVPAEKNGAAGRRFSVGLLFVVLPMAATWF